MMVFASINYEIIIAFSIAVLIYVVTVWTKQVNNKFPPGPIGLPIVGYVPFLTKDVHLKFIELGQKYGNIFSVKLGAVNIVVLNKAEDIRDAFSKSELLARPSNNSFTIFEDKSPFFVGGITIWQDQRKFVVNALKELGLGKTKIEGQIQEEIRYFLNVLKSDNGKAKDFTVPLACSTSNNICALVFGKRYDYDDPERILLDKSLADVVRILGQTSLHVFFPWIRKVPFILKWLKYEEGINAFKRSREIFNKKIKEHKETLDPNNIRDFIDGYLVEMKYRQENDPNTTFNDDTLQGSVGDLFGAGSESVRTTITWCIYTIAVFEDVQRKIQEEIAEILGQSRGPQLSDMKQMPYTHAVMLEVMRWKCIVPINVPRCTTADIALGEYIIPKGTTVMANLWAVHHDPRHWKNPDIFQPERFLDSDGKSVQKIYSYMPFSVGKRICPGESMAYMEVFLYFVSILQNFNVTLAENIKPTFEAELSVTYHLKPFLAHFLERKEMH